jgi:hypothetical protein
VRHGDYEELNAQDFELYREMGWPDVLEKAAEATRQLVAQAEARSEEELEAESRPGRKLWQSIEGTGHSHSMVHLTEIYLKRGDAELATRLRMDTVAELERLDDSPGWQGMVRYDLACHHALVGEKERAIEVLREALGLNPELTEWSKEDPDFAPLRDDPGYQALYTQRAGKGEDK